VWTGFVHRPSNLIRVMPAKEVDERLPALPVVRRHMRMEERRMVVMKAVVVASGALDAADVAQIDDAALLIAADGGAVELERLGRRPHRLIGDLDSVDAALVERLADQGTQVERHPVDKDASDSELALEAAIAAGAGSIVILGALGAERLDHELANLLLLADPAFAGRDVRIVRGATTVRAVGPGGSLDLDATVGSIVTLLPIGGDVSGVSTRGLRWHLEGAVLRFGRSRGLSNEIAGRPASVSIGAGSLLVIEIERGGGDS